MCNGVCADCVWRAPVCRAVVRGLRPQLMGVGPVSSPPCGCVPLRSGPVAPALGFGGSRVCVCGCGSRLAHKSSACALWSPLWLFPGAALCGADGAAGGVPAGAVVCVVPHGSVRVCTRQAGLRGGVRVAPRPAGSPGWWWVVRGLRLWLYWSRREGAFCIPHPPLPSLRSSAAHSLKPRNTALRSAESFAYPCNTRSVS